MAACVLALAALSLLIATASAQNVRVDGYMVYVTCSSDGKHHSGITHECHQGDLVRTILRNSKQPLEYDVCINLGGERTVCEDSRRAEPGTSSIAVLPTHNFVGLATVTWRAGSTTVGSWNVRFVQDPVVPPFGTYPLIISGTHRLFGLQITHVLASARVRAWRQCGGSTCRLPLRQAFAKGEERRFRVVGSRDAANFSLGEVLYVLVDAPRKRFHGSKLWGRLYTGRLVRNAEGGPKDTAIRQIGAIQCTPPGSGLSRATSCRNVPGLKTS